MNEYPKFYRKLVGLVFMALVAFGAIFAYQNKWQIRDRLVSRSYISSEKSEVVRSSLSLSEEGDLVYRASLTEVDGKDKFRERCPVKSFEEASVLGCYAKQRIYVLEVNETKLKGVEEVTAAHELLHAQFERMRSRQKKELFGLLDKLNSELEDKDTKNLLASYEKQLGKGEELYNEMFAIFGTQLERVGPELEAIYDNYFLNRAQLVKMFQAYSGEFKRLEQAVADYDAELSKLRAEKDALEAELNAKSSELESEKNRIDSLANDGSSEYRSQALAYNAEVEEYNRKVKRIQNVVEEYNRIVEERNALALSVKNLQDKLNANVTER